MKITATKENLLNALRKANCAVGSRPANPLMNNICLEAKGDRLTLTATDGEISVVTWINVLVEAEGKTTLPAKKTLQIISALPQGDVTILTDQDHRSTVTSQKTVYKLLGISGDEYPDMLKDTNFDWSFEMKSADFMRSLSKVAYAKSLDETRKQLNGVVMSIRSGMISIAATDGRRLAMVDLQLEDTAAKDGDYIIPSRAATELSRCLEGGEQNVKIQLNDNMIVFATTGTMLITKKVEGVYPDFRRIIPKESDFTVSIPRQAFIDTISRVALVVMDNAGSIRLTFRKGVMDVSANNPETGEAREPLDVNYESDEEVMVAFNPIYFLDPLKVMDSDQVTIAFGKQYNPVKLTGEEGFLYMLMPMRG